MNESRTMGRREVAAGDAAVEGLFHGMGAGLAMAVVIVLAGLAAGQAAGRVLGHLDPAGVSPITGLTVHLAVSGVYGMLFGLILRWLPVGGRGWLLWALAGLAYAALLWLVSLGLLSLPAAAHMRDMPAFGWAAGHAVYGLVLGILAGRAGRG